MRLIITAAALATVAGQAHAQNIAAKPLVEARTRVEHVEQDGIADATTVRVRAGVQASSGPVTVLAEAQGNLAVAGDYYDGLNGAAARPLIADPQNIALYRAQIQYRTNAFTLTAGRQKLTLDDERFVGNVGFRQNAQTFDAVRAEVTPLKGLKLDLAYAWGVRTIWGIDGTGGRQGAVGGDNVFANLSYATPVGTLSGFAYLADQDEAAVQGYRLSSQTYGGRLAGSRAIGQDVKLGYALSYARQSDYHRNPNAYSADYWLADATLDVKALKLNLGYEILGADGGVALTSFQTPLGTNFKFQGWADKFLTTPPNGMRDLYGGAGYGWKKLGRIDAINLQAVYHRFDSDRLDIRYGDEIDLLASVKVRKTVFSLRYADYNARGFATDTRKIWFQIDWSY